MNLKETITKHKLLTAVFLFSLGIILLFFNGLTKYFIIVVVFYLIYLFLRWLSEKTELSVFQIICTFGGVSYLVQAIVQSPDASVAVTTALHYVENILIAAIGYAMENAGSIFWHIVGWITLGFIGYALIEVYTNTKETNETINSIDSSLEDIRYRLEELEYKITDRNYH